MGTSDSYSHRRGDYRFWMEMGWNKRTAENIANACSGQPGDRNRSGWMLRDSFRNHPEACLDVRHPMFWYGRGHDVGEAVEKAVMAVALVGKVQPDQSSPPAGAMGMLEVFFQTISVQQPEAGPQQITYDNYRGSHDVTHGQQEIS